MSFNFLFNFVKFFLIRLNYVFTDILKISLFEEYKIESINNNEISFEINLDHLQRALKSGQYAQEVILKLTKKNGQPFLSMSVESTQQMTIIQDVPIVLLSAQQLGQYTEPHLPDPEVHLKFRKFNIIFKFSLKFHRLSVDIDCRFTL